MTTDGSGFWSSGKIPLIEPEVLSSIIKSASDIALVVDTDGTVLSVIVNDQADGFGNLTHWEGRAISEFLSSDSVPKFERVHEAYKAGKAPSGPVELNHTDNATWQYPVRYTFHHFGTSGAVLLLGRDLRAVAETQQQLVQAQVALEQGYEARREFDARYRMLLSQTREPVLFVAVSDGRVLDCSEPAADMLGLKRDALQNAGLASVLKDRSASELMESLLNASLADGGATVEARAARGDKKVIFSPHVFRAGGQRMVFCRLLTQGEDRHVPDADMARARALVAQGSDAIVFADDSGDILSVNDAFLDLVGIAHSGDLKGRSLGDFLVRGQIDLGVLIDNAKRAGHMRVYATKAMNELGSRIAVEVSASYLSDLPAPVLAFVLRDVSRVEGVRSTSASQMPEDSSRNVIELVGSASLKDIVAETTDVVEKMCIETAVSLTNNNRVAAAEMLGLSRQSLYVKLRKYGLLSKE